MRRPPDAAAGVRGNGICANVKFFGTENGVIAVVEARGLPWSDEICKGAVLGMHIHAGTDCLPRGEDRFGGAMGHYDTDKCPHPFHAGDMPPLFSNGGYAFSAFFTDRFSVKDIIGKTVIIHSHPDDFTSQPAGMSGEKLACGIIRVTRG